MRKRAAVASFEHLERRSLLSAVKIMPIGDSITESFPGHASFRFFLYNQLENAGYDVDFVGSKTGVNGGSPVYSNFDQDHEGHSGFRTDQIQSRIAGWASANKPDVVLLHVGSNDIEQNQNNSGTINEISGLIDNLRSVVPKVKILLAQIVPETSRMEQFAALNNLIANLADDKDTSASPVTLVDQFSGFDPFQDTFDGIHPDESGERKMADRWFNALTKVLPAPEQSDATYLSELEAASSNNAWGPVEADRSNGESNVGDGRTMAINGVGYLKGLGMHAGADITYNIAGGEFNEFASDIGVDDEVGPAGSVVFKVLVDGQTKYTSPVMTGSTGKLSIAVPLPSSASSLRLVVTTAGDEGNYDHADWGNARLIEGDPITVTPPATPTKLKAGFNNGTGKINLTWRDNATDETGVRVVRKTGASGAYKTIASLPAGSASYVDSSSLVAGKKYYYRVLSYKSSGVNSAYSAAASATVPVSTATYLSDLDFTTTQNGWGPAERDRSNGELAENDGRLISIAGVKYNKGLGIHAESDLLFNLGGQYSRFLSDVGLDDETAGGSVVFRVYGDGEKLYDSNVITNQTGKKSFNLDVNGVNKLRLVVTAAGDEGEFDHADWAGARLTV